MISTTEPPADTDNDTGERRERWIVACLAVVVVSAALVGRVTTPTDADLLDSATTETEVRGRVRAMNALIVRGYWEERPLAELRTFLDDSPPEIEGFVVAMHGSLLRKR